jgi:hypothetical protein
VQIIYYIMVGGLANDVDSIFMLMQLALVNPGVVILCTSIANEDFFEDEVPQLKMK